MGNTKESIEELWDMANGRNMHTGEVPEEGTRENG